MTSDGGNQVATAPAAAAPEGRQAIKSHLMRTRICEGATHCIAHGGYFRTSIQQVVRQCAISPGALQHHFPTKIDLVAATAAHLLGKSVRWFGRIKTSLAADPQAFAEAVRRSWREQFSTPEYAALLEILVASRTDAKLRARIAPALNDWRAAIEAELRALIPASDDRATIEAIITISRALMTGLLVHDGLTDDEDRVIAVLNAWIELATRR